MRLEGWHIVVMIVLAIVLFGAPKLPGMARSVGQSLRIFRSEIRQMKDDDVAPDAGAASGDTYRAGTPGAVHPVHPVHPVSGEGSELYVPRSRSAGTGGPPGTP